MPKRGPSQLAHTPTQPHTHGTRRQEQTTVERKRYRAEMWRQLHPNSTVPSNIFETRPDRHPRFLDGNDTRNFMIGRLTPAAVQEKRTKQRIIATITFKQGDKETITSAHGFTNHSEPATPAVKSSAAHTIEMSWTLRSKTVLATRHESATNDLKKAKTSARRERVNPRVKAMHNAHNITHHLRPGDLNQISIWDSKNNEHRSLADAIKEKGQCGSNLLMGVESAQANGNWFVLCESPLVTLRNQCLNKSVVMSCKSIEQRIGGIRLRHKFKVTFEYPNDPTIEPITIEFDLHNTFTSRRSNLILANAWSRLIYDNLKSTGMLRRGAKCPTEWLLGIGNKDISRYMSENVQPVNTETSGLKPFAVKAAGSIAPIKAAGSITPKRTKPTHSQACLFPMPLPLQQRPKPEQLGSEYLPR